MWTHVSAASAIAPGDYAQVEVDGIIVAVFNIDGNFYAIEDVCTHDGGGLAGGAVEDCQVICPRHGARFCLRTGAALSPPAYEPVRTFFDRTLTRRGSEEAAEMARRLKQRKLRPDLIVSSPAPRALGTAEIFARTLLANGKSRAAGNDLIVTDERLYAAGPAELFKTLRECDDRYGHVLVTAHNPGITEFADRLCEERHIESMPTSAVVTMLFDIQTWRELAAESGREVEFDYPGRTPD
jgi:phosphohistidine phosphatase SixA